MDINNLEARDYCTHLINVCKTSTGISDTNILAKCAMNIVDGQVYELERKHYRSKENIATDEEEAYFNERMEYLNKVKYILYFQSL